MRRLRAVANGLTRRHFGLAVAGTVLVGTVVTYAASVVVTDTMSVRLRVVESDFPEGFDTGWHTHPGPAIVQVREGTFKIYQGGCEPHVVHEGETYIEVPLQPVRAIAKGAIAWTTTQVLPGGEAAQVPAASPCP